MKLTYVMILLLQFVSAAGMAETLWVGNQTPNHGWHRINQAIYCSILTDNGDFVREADISKCQGKYGWSRVNGAFYCSIQTPSGDFVKEVDIYKCPIRYGWAKVNGANYCAIVTENGNYVREVMIERCLTQTAPQKQAQKFALNVSYFPKETQIIPLKSVIFPVNLATGKINKCEWLENQSESRTGNCSICVKVESDIDRNLTLRSMLVSGIRAQDDILTFDITNDPVVESVNCKVEKVSEIKTREQIKNFGLGLGLQIEFPSAADF